MIGRRIRIPILFTKWPARLLAYSSAHAQSRTLILDVPVREGKFQNCSTGSRTLLLIPLPAAWTLSTFLNELLIVSSLLVLFVIVSLFT